MKTTITLGKSGRLVVPKKMRDQLGLHEGSQLKVEIHGGKLEATPEPDSIEMDMEDGFPVIRNARPLAPGRVVRAIKAGRDDRS